MTKHNRGSAFTRGFRDAKFLLARAGLFNSAHCATTPWPGADPGEDAAACWAAWMDADPRR